MKECPVCNTKLLKEYCATLPDIDCPCCGRFNFSCPNFANGNQDENIYNVLEMLMPKERANLSGFIRECQNNNESHCHFLTIDEINRLKQCRHPSVFEKADKLLLYFDKNTDYAGKWLDCPKDKLMGISWAVRSEGSDPYKELNYLLDYLCTTKKFLEYEKDERVKGNGNQNQSLNSFKFCITPLGHEYIQTLKHAVINSNKGFCAMWYGGENQTEKYDNVWEKAIAPAIRNAGYEAKRIDKKEHVNDINDEMLMEIRQSRFVVCDFNKECNGVYFEAGFTKGLNLPVIWTCEESELKARNIHFDVNHYNFITWTDNNLDDFCKKLQTRIEAVLGHGKN